MLNDKKYIGMDVHKESISIAVRNGAGKIVMECVIETKASMILQFIDGLRGDLHVTFEEGTSAAWLYDLLKPHVTRIAVCDRRKNVTRVRELYRRWAIPCTGKQVYAPQHRAEWLGKNNQPGGRRRAEFYYQQLDALRGLRA